MSHPKLRRVRARRLTVYLAAVLGAVGVGAAKQDTAWTFEVRELVVLGPLAHEIYLAPAPPGINFPRTCKLFVIQAHFVRGKGVPPP